VIAHPARCRGFVGRREELAALSAARRALAHSRGSLVLIGGEAGIGKSRLVAQFLREVQGGRACRVAVAECVPGGAAPFAPVRAWLRKLLPGALPAGAPPLALRALAQVVPEALPGRIADDYAAAGLGTAELFAGLADAFRLLTAKRAAIAVADDVHWADRSTLDFVAYLAAHVASMRLMLIATYRPDELESDDALAGATARLLRERSLRHAVLEPLAQPDVMDLLRGALDATVAVEQRVLREIASRSEGNPLFAEELLKDALDVPRAGAAQLPASLRAMVRERLARLPRRERRILEIAAVLGTRFDPAVLARVAERTPGDVLAALRRARDAGLVAEDDAGTMGFRHALTREAVRDGMLRAEVRALHRAILAVYESSTEPNRPLDALAYHAWEAGDAPAAFEYNERAGAAALALGALPEAVRCFERAVELARDDEQRARALESRGSALAAQGELSAAVASLEAALRIRLAREEYDDAVRVFVAAQSERSNAGEVVADTLLSFITTYGARLGRSARDALYVFTARVLSGDCAFEAVRMLLADVSAPDDLPPRVRANYVLCFLNMHGYRGDVPAWRRAAQAARATVARLPPQLRAIVLTTVAQTGVWIGGGDLVTRSLDEADAVATRYGLGAVGTFARAVRAHAAFAAGDLAAARALVEAVLQPPEVPVAQLVAAMTGPFVARALGETSLAERCLASACVARTLAEERATAERALLVAAQIAASGPPEDASGGARLIDEIRLLPADAPLYPTLFVLAAERVAADDLPDVVQRASPERLHPDDCAGRATSALVRAIAARRERHSAEAAGLASEAARAFDALGWPLFEALAWEIAGERQRALLLYRRCGAAAGVRRLSPRAPTGAVGRSATRTRADASGAVNALSAREREIARLIADGETNTAIAERLGVSRKTVEKHVTSILAKLAFRSRAQIAAYVASSGAG
jgi:DNA-binding CsgD family transcriptional regulator/tetratricopeptide (TPR) repeat protein